MPQLVGVVGAFLRKFGDDVLPLAEPMLSTYFSGMLTEPNRPPDEQCVALMLITDVIEYAPSSVKYLPQILPRLLDFAASSDTRCCNAAVYGLGVIAEVHPEVCTSLSCFSRCFANVTSKIDEALIANIAWADSQMINSRYFWKHELPICAWNHM